MPLISKNYNYDLALKSIAPNGLSNTENLAIGNYNGSNFALEIASDIGEWLSKNFGNVALVKDCYLCFNGNNDVGDCYVTGKEDGASDAIRCDDYAYKVPLLHLVGEASKSNPAYFYCPQPNGYTTLQLATAWIEADVLDCSLNVPEYDLHVYKKGNTLDLSKVHVSPKAIFTNADGQPEEVELERSSYSLSLTSDGEANYLNVSYLNQTVQKKISLHEYKDLFYDPDKDESVSIYDNDNSPAPLKMDIYFPTAYAGYGSNPKINAVITLHGGGWSGGNRAGYSHHRQRITDNGLVCVNMDYSLLGSANIPNDITPCVKMLGDIGSAIIKVKTKMSECGLELGKVALMGYSAGGHLALMYGLLNPYNATDKTGISLIVAEGAPTYFTKYDLHAVDSGYDNSDSLYIPVPEQHNQMATNIRVMAGVDSDLLEPIETSCWKIRAISPADLPDNFQYGDFTQTGGKILLAYGKENSTNESDGLIPYSRGVQMKGKYAEDKNCILKEINGCANHNYLCNGSWLENNAGDYLTVLNDTLATFSIA